MRQSHAAARRANHAFASTMSADGTVGGVIELGAHDGRNALSALLAFKPLVRMVGDDGAGRATAGAGAVRTEAGCRIKSGSFHDWLFTLTIVIYLFIRVFIK
jgi:hypothetical protein